MKYMLMIYGDTFANALQSDPERQAEMQAYNTFTEDAHKSGVMLSGEALMPISTATTVRVRDGKTLTTDGPFAETKEQLGGYYIFECKDLDEAITWAAKIPNPNGSVEVRPLVVWG